MTDVERCQHGVRWPHPCDDCHEEDMKPHNLIARIEAQDDTIATLRTNIAVKADWIEKTINDMAEQDDTIASLRKQLDDARAEALEEAAKVADSWGVGHPHIAKQIRALKGKS